MVVQSLPGSPANESRHFCGTFLTSLRNLIGPWIFFNTERNRATRELLVGFPHPSRSYADEKLAGRVKRIRHR